MARFLASVLVVAAGSVSASGNPPQKERSVGDDEKEVRAVVQAVRSATLKRDATALKPLLADTFTGLTPVGSRFDKAGWLDGVAKGTLLSAHKADEMEELGEELTIHGSTVATVTNLWRFRIAATKRDYCLQGRAVYARLGEGWQLVSNQGSMLHDGPLVTVSQDGLTGKYAIEGGGTYTISKTGRTLFGQRSAMPQKSPIFETADGGFEGPLGRWQFTFHREGDGKVTGLTFRSDGKDRWRAKKVE